MLHFKKDFLKEGASMRYIEGINRKSKIAFPEYIDDYITEDNTVRIIDAFVQTLDMNELEDKGTFQLSSNGIF